MTVAHYALLIAIAAVITVVVTPAARAVGCRMGAVARPGGRNVHEGLIPCTGGVAIFAGILGALAMQYFGELRLDWPVVLMDGMGASTSLVGVFVGLGLIFLVGLADDMWHLNPGAKFAGQIIAAAVVAVSGLRIEFVGNPFSSGLILLGVLAIPVTVLYLVAFANIINLIDGLDGLAAGVSAIAAASLFVLATQGNRLDAAVLAAAVVGACVGFLRFNFHPASVFMGDSGSMLLGFTLATASLLGVMKTTAAIALAVPLLIVGVPIFDTASAIIRRIRHKRPIQEADKGHIHHRLLGIGFDQRQTVLIIYAWSVALALGGYAVRYAPPNFRLFTFGVLAALSGLMANWLGLFEAARHHADEDDQCS